MGVEEENSLLDRLSHNGRLHSSYTSPEISTFLLLSKTGHWDKPQIWSDLTLPLFFRIAYFSGARIRKRNPLFKKKEVLLHFLIMVNNCNGLEKGVGKFQAAAGIILDHFPPQSPVQRLSIGSSWSWIRTVWLPLPKMKVRFDVSDEAPFSCSSLPSIFNGVWILDAKLWTVTKL